MRAHSYLWTCWIIHACTVWRSCPSRERFRFQWTLRGMVGGLVCDKMLIGDLQAPPVGGRRQRWQRALAFPATPTPTGAGPPSLGMLGLGLGRLSDYSGPIWVVALVPRWLRGIVRKGRALLQVDCTEQRRGGLGFGDKAESSAQHPLPPFFHLLYQEAGLNVFPRVEMDRSYLGFDRLSDFWLFPSLHYSWPVPRDVRLNIDRR